MLLCKEEAVAIVEVVFLCFMEKDVPVTQIVIRHAKYPPEYAEGFPGDKPAADFSAGEPGLVDNENIQTCPGEGIPGRCAGRTCSNDQGIDYVRIRQSANQGLR